MQASGGFWTGAGLNYQDTWLWKRAFIDPRTDAPPEEQAYFAQRYEAMRDKCAALVGRIAADMGYMTVHDISHLDALWEMASIVTKDALDLNPAEAFVFGGAILIHDAAMSLAAYPNGLADLRTTTAWRDARARALLAHLDDPDVVDSKLDDLATADALRRLHAAQAQNLPTQAWYAQSDEPEFLIDDPEVRRFYGPKIGLLGHSHWWSVGRVEEEFVTDLGPLGGRTSNRIGLVKLACLLRVADAMHIDRRRAPAFLRKLLNPEGVSNLHWIFQERMAVPYVDEGALVYSAAPAFELEVAESWWLAFDAIQLINTELQDVDHLLQSRGSPRLLAHRVRGVTSAGSLARYVETIGWDPVETRVRVSDVPKIVGTLGGEKLYGAEPSVALRELIQNSSDAISARRALEERPEEWGTVVVSLEERKDGIWLTVEDIGVGMSIAVLTGPLIDFGNSFWRSALAAEEFPGLQASGIKAVGRYGIGFFAVFMLGDRVRVTTRRYDQAAEAARTLEFRDGLGSRPILYRSPRDSVPRDGGTRVEVLLRVAPELPGGLLHSKGYREESWSLASLCGALAPAVACTLKVMKPNGSLAEVIRPNDWLSISDAAMRQRILGWKAPRHTGESSKHARLRTITDPSGEVYGRAAISSDSTGSTTTGCITVGGLRAAPLTYFEGLLAGRESTASRNDAIATVPPELLATWASEQARLISLTSAYDYAKARMAKVVLRCGGDLADLPVARWSGKWLSKDELAARVMQRSKIYVYDEHEVIYDSDDDEVHPREFEENFRESKTVLFLPDDILDDRTLDWDKSLPLLDESKPHDFEAILRQVLEDVWASYSEDEWVYHSVGSVGEIKITRAVTVFTRLK